MPSAAGGSKDQRGGHSGRIGGYVRWPEKSGAG